MKNLLCLAILPIAALGAGLICQAQSNVYSIGGMSPDSFLPAVHRPDEIKLWNSAYGSGLQTSCVEWYVSTNLLAKQPHWDGLSTEVPLSARKACALSLPYVRKAFPRTKSWSVEEVILRKPYLGVSDAYPDVWWYQVTFRPSASEDRDSKDFQRGYYAGIQIVLLDGTVVPQTVLQKK